MPPRLSVGGFIVGQIEFAVVVESVRPSGLVHDAFWSAEGRLGIAINRSFPMNPCPSAEMADVTRYPFGK
jgi:hypothetical protein